MAIKKNSGIRPSKSSSRIPSKSVPVEIESQVIKMPVGVVKTARQVLFDYGGCYELYEGEDYLRFWIVGVDGRVPKEYLVVPLSTVVEVVSKKKGKGK